MTRACTAVAMGQWYDALMFHPLVFGLLAFALLFAIAPRRSQQVWLALPRYGRFALWCLVYFSVLVVWLTRGS